MLAGLCALLVGIGLARFAYTPLLPALIAAGWFTPSAAAYLGAANLAGYLAGALIGRPLAARAAPATVLRGMMLLAAVSFFACASPWSFAWFFVWRLLSGIAGGALMVLAAPAVMPHVPPARRGLAGGVIFTGVGIGIALSGTLVPWLLRSGLVATWCGLGVLALALTAVAWGRWPRTPAASPPMTTSAAPRAFPRPALTALYLEYGLNAAGLVPHMIFLVDFVARGLDAGLEVGARYWVLAGLGATAGPVVAGKIADRVGFRATLRGAFVVQAAAVALPAIAPTTVSLVVSSVLVGALIPGVVPIVFGRTQQLIEPGQDASGAWSLATMSFALFQAAGAWGFSFLYARTGTHTALFVVGTVLVVLGLLLDLVVRSAPERICKPGPVTRTDS